MDTRVEEKPAVTPPPAAPRVSVLPSSAARGAFALSPLNARRWRNFKKNRRGYWSLWLFLCLFIITLFAEFIANDKPILAVYKGEVLFPVLVDYPVVFATLYIFALLGLLVNLVTDFVYTMVDPRIDFETREV